MITSPTGEYEAMKALGAYDRNESGLDDGLDNESE
jgi:hypothetical protein